MDFERYMRIRNILDQLQLSLQIIHQLLTDLENAITFARNNILHSSIIRTNDLKSIIDTMLQKHTKEQILYFKDEELLKYYDAISVDAYYSNEMIVFILHFPLMHPSTFTHYHLYSIPTKNLTTIVPPAPFLIMNTELYEFMDSPCKKLNSIYICQNKFDQLDSSSQKCVYQLLQLEDNQAYCHQVPVSINLTLIEQLTPGHYIGIFPQPAKITTHCSSNTGIRVLQGTYLIVLPPNCKFRTSQGDYINNKEFIPEQPLTLLKVKSIAVSTTKKLNPVKLGNVPLDELHKLTNLDGRFQPLITDGTERDTDFTHLWTTPLYIVITVALLAIAFGCHRRLTNKTKKTLPKDQVLFVPYKTSLGDEAVTGHTTPSQQI